MGKPMKIVVGSLAVGVAAVGLFLYSRNASAKQEGIKTVEIGSSTARLECGTMRNTLACARAPVCHKVVPASSARDTSDLR